MLRRVSVLSMAAATLACGLAMPSARAEGDCAIKNEYGTCDVVAPVPVPTVPGPGA